ncbi:hypothetical protein P8452_30479 [Trifolium repens]|nr:hypothetical protein P8452_30479 [Trifolium repens]
MVEAQISCQIIEEDIVPCIGFLTGGDDGPDQQCCDAVIGIDDEATANNGQKDTCRCLGKFGSSLYGLFIEENGAALFAKCGAKTHYKISLSSDDCDSYSSIKAKEVVADSGLWNILTTIYMRVLYGETN